MISITENYEIEFTDEMTDALNEVAVKIGDAIKDMPPLEKFYALQTICAEIDSRVTMYTILGMIRDNEEDAKNS